MQLPRIGDQAHRVWARYRVKSVRSLPWFVRSPSLMKLTSSTSRRLVSAEEALALWSEYKRTGDLQVRNRLVMTFAPLVKYIVFKKVRELPARCEVEDFISCGLEALIASI